MDIGLNKFKNWYNILKKTHQKASTFLKVRVLKKEMNWPWSICQKEHEDCKGKDYSKITVSFLLSHLFLHSFLQDNYEEVKYEMIDYQKRNVV